MPTTQVETARMLLRVRALRWDYFRVDLFDEYAWNILLVLFIAQASGQDMTEETTVRDAQVPATVGKRWITHLEQSGLATYDEETGFLRLTDHSRAEMVEYLDEVARAVRK